MKRSLAFVVGGLALLATQSLTAQVATFRAGVEAVRIDALVTDDGRPISGLTLANFELFDNGRRQTIEHVSVDRIPLNLVLTLDLSESVAGAPLDRLRDAGRAALTGLRPDEQSALLLFGDRLLLKSPLTANIQQVRDAIGGGVGKGNTALIDAAYATLLVSEGRPGRALAIVFSDGMDTASWLRAERVMEGARRTDLVIYGVTFDRSGDNRFLADLSNTTGGRVFTLDSSSRLAETFTAILEEFRQRYVIGYTPSDTAAGWHEVDLRVKGRRAKVTTRRGYLTGRS